MAGFRAVSDAFSVKIDRVDDALFWLRLEFGAPSQVVVTDLTLSQAPSADAALALAQGMAMCGQPQARKFLFRDVAPHGAVQDRLDEIRAVLGAYAKKRSLFLSDWQVLARGQKIDVLATLDR